MRYTAFVMQGIRNALVFLFACALTLPSALLSFPQEAHAATSTIIITSGSSWSVPSNWTNVNTIECVGAGGDGAAANTTTGGNGGGGGAYAKITNLSLSPGASVSYRVGAHATSSGTLFNETYFNSSASSTASLSCAYGKVAAVGATAATSGGSTVNSTGTTKYAGGDGGSRSGTTNRGGTGGGGSGGPLDAGKRGGNVSGNHLGTGGGGSDGGSSTNGGDGAGNDGTQGGHGDAGTGGGAGGATGSGAASGGNGTAGTAGSGAGGGGGGAVGLGGTGAGGAGGSGAISDTFDSTHGTGGGGGGGGGINATGNTANPGSGGAGGTYGGGGGGGGSTAGTGTNQSGGTGGQGLIVITYTEAVAPDVPTVLDATAGNSQVSLTWTAPVNVGGDGQSITNYKIYRGTSSNPTTLHDTIGNTTSYTDTTSITSGTLYYYRVTAVNYAGLEGAYATEDSATPFAVAPGTPTGLTATAGSGQINVSWTAPASDGGGAITNYKVYRDTVSPATTLHATVGNVLNLVDTTSIVNGTTYFYRVKATNSAGDSAFSNEDSATPQSGETPRIIRLKGGIRLIGGIRLK